MERISLCKANAQRRLPPAGYSSGWTLTAESKKKERKENKNIEFE